MSDIQLFAVESELPEGFVYKPELISHDEEQPRVRQSTDLSSERERLARFDDVS